MRMTSMKINNFRGYNEEINIVFDNLTAIVGRNDVGKSTILEALDIFFNEGKGTIKIDKNDVNNYAFKEGNDETSITVCFADLPKNVIIDSSVNTTLTEEYLLNHQGQLEVIKKYKNGGSAKVYLKANYPSNKKCSELLIKKNSELKKIISNENIPCENVTINSLMRKAIYNKYKNDLQLNECEIDVSKEDAKKIWDKLKLYLPIYSLFQSDRNNSDTDSEIQDPLKAAVKQILQDESLQKKLSEIANIVRERITEVSSRTLNKLQEMDRDIADSLNPIIPKTEELKWQDVFKNVSISGDEDIPINKRGSGVRRLILLNFFRAEAERRAESNDDTTVIYAIEEPETSQHTNNQFKLINSLKSLSNSPKTQILITTHSPNIVKQLSFSNLRLINNSNIKKTIENVEPGKLRYPSLNEVNFIAFGETTEEYHNELYGFIESQNWLNEYKNNGEKLDYIRLKHDGTTCTQKITLTEYIRHQIHHPENTNNRRFTNIELKNSIDFMREFIDSKEANL